MNSRKFDLGAGEDPAVDPCGTNMRADSSDTGDASQTVFSTITWAAKWGVWSSCGRLFRQKRLTVLRNESARLPPLRVEEAELCFGFFAIAMHPCGMPMEKNVGAGRPRGLDDEAAWAIGEFCEHEFRRHWKEALDNQIGADAGEGGRLEVPFDHIASFLKEVELDSMEDRERKYLTEHAPLMEETLAAALGKKEDGSAVRGLRYVQPRPKGKREAIITSAMERFAGSHGLTRSAVDAAWKTHRRFLKELKRHMKSYVPDPDNAAFSDEV
jgi:hypothetical protein